MSEFRSGQLIEFKVDRQPTDETPYLPSDKRYTKGTRGYIVDISANGEGNIYKVKTNEGTKIEVPERDLLDPNKGIREKVEERLREKQRHKEFQDTEVRVGGSKKEKAAYRVISLADLEDIEKDEATAIELIRKDKVYPKVEISEEQDKGTSAGAAFLKVQLRKSYGAKPPNNPDKRKIYVGYAEYLVKKFDDVISVDEFDKIREKLSDDGLMVMIKILNKDIGKKVEDEIEEYKEKADKLQKRIEKLEKEQEKEQERIINKFPDLSWGEIDPDEQARYYAIYDEIQELKKERTGYKAREEIPPILETFVEKVTGKTGYYSKRYVTQDIFEEIFGKRFVNFIRKSTEAITKTYEQAKDYEALSLKESEELTKKDSGYMLNDLKSKREDVETLKSLKSIEQFDDFFIKQGKGHYGFWGWKPTGYSYYEESRKKGEGAKFVEWYAEKHRTELDKNILKLEERLEKVKEKYRARENDWSWATAKGNLPKGEKSELKANQYPPLSYIKRIGGIKITDEDVTVASIKEKFGFRAVEFGQALKDEDAREHIRHFLGAMADLGEILNMDIIQLNKIGNLSIAFASRGAGGASAHYESLRKIINVTKSRGDGSVAHEYMHYIDNMLPKIDNPDYSYEDWASHERKGSYLIDSVKNEEVQDRIRDVFNYIYDKKYGETDEKTIIEETIYAQSEKTFGIPKHITGNTIEEYYENFKDYYSHYKYYEKLTKRDKDILGYIVNKFGYESYVFEFETQQSAYYAFSSKMKSKYWIRPHELFARAFETYIFDKLEKGERVNNYLVSGAYFDRPERVYPQDREREDLYLLYDKLFEIIKKEYNIADFRAWTNERTDEYIDFEEKEKEEVEAGVIVDSKTGEVEEKKGDTTNIKKKIQKLIEMLAVESLKTGGNINGEKFSDKLIENFT